METATDQATRDKVFELIKDIQVAQLVTVDQSGKMRGRPMIAQKVDEDGRVLWFYTPAQSGKMDEIQHHHQVMLTYSEPKDQTYVNVLGQAEIQHDRQKIKDMWTESMRVWFPKGSDDPDIALLKVEVQEADYWDTGSSTIIHAYGYVKAIVTGERPNPGDVKHVEFGSATKIGER